jgi:4-aminobutyrate aminotransferase
VGVTISTPEIAESFKGMQISTFGGNPVTCAGARAVIQVIEEDQLAENAHTVGGYFRQGLEGLKEKYDLIGDVRGMGMMQALELVKDRKTKEPAPQETNALMEEARRQGILIGKGGLYGNVIRMSPPMNITKADVDEGIKKLDAAMAKVAQPAAVAGR